MRIELGILVVLAFANFGCGSASKADSPPSTARAAESTGSKLYTQLRAGAFNLDAAATSLESALQTSRKLLKEADGEPKQALLDLVALVDDAGEAIADDTTAPTSDEVEKDRTGHEKDRTDAIEHANDALKSVAEAATISGDLAQSAPEELRADAEALDKNIVEAQDAIKDAIHELGTASK
jgi:hypothetical protein